CHTSRRGNGWRSARSSVLYWLQSPRPNGSSFARPSCALLRYGHHGVHGEYTCRRAFAAAGDDKLGEGLVAWRHNKQEVWMADLRAAGTSRGNKPRHMSAYPIVPVRKCSHLPPVAAPSS